MLLQEAHRHQQLNGQKISKAADKALALLLPDNGPIPMEISTVYTSQDTENEYETEQCGIDMSHKCDRAEEQNNGSSKIFIVRGVR